MTVKIIIANEMDLTLEGIKTVLREHSTFQVIGTCQLLSDLLSLLANTSPDVILLDDKIEPDLDVLALVEQVKRAAPRSRLIVMGNLPDGLIVQEVLTCGAAGYLYKSDPLAGCLVEAIKTVLRNRPYLSPTTNSEYLLAMQSDRADWQLDTEGREVLRMLAQGVRRKEIAIRLGVTLRRVHNVCERLRHRFGAETNEQLIARAAEEGFLS